MRPFLISVFFVSMCGCGPTIITRDNSLRAQLERELNDDDVDRFASEVRQQLPIVTPKPGLQRDDSDNDHPHVVNPLGARSNRLRPKHGVLTKPAQVKILDGKIGIPRSDEPVFDGKADPNGEIPTREFDPRTTYPNHTTVPDTGFRFKTGEVDPPVPSLQELTQRGCSEGERVLRIEYAKEQDDIYLDWQTQMNSASLKDGDDRLRAVRVAMTERDATLDKARKNYLWMLDQLHQNCQRTLHE